MKEKTNPSIKFLLEGMKRLKIMKTKAKNNKKNLRHVSKKLRKIEKRMKKSHVKKQLSPDKALMKAAEMLDKIG